MSNLAQLLERDTTERPPRVLFKRDAVENPRLSREQGIAVCVDVDFVTLMQAGGGGNGVTFEVPDAIRYYEYEVRNGRMPQKWLEDFKTMYGMWKNGQELPINGTPIRGWLVISPAQQANLIAKNVMTIEDLASLNTEGINRIGMGAVELKNKAMAALQAAKDTGPLVMKNAQLEAELTLLKANFADLERKFTQAVGALNATATKTEPAAYERPSLTAGISAADILDDSDVELALLYENKFGEKPHHRMKRETIERALKA